MCVEAFDVAERLGVGRLLNADDMLLLVVPDKLNVMTFIYELRAQLTGCSVPSAHSSSPHDTQSASVASSRPIHAQTPSSATTSGDWLSNLCPLTATERQAVDARCAASLHTKTEASSLAQTGKQLLACVAQSSEVTASPTDHLQTASSLPLSNDDDSAILMTRQQLLNPFDSDSDSEVKTPGETKSAKRHLSATAEKTSRQRETDVDQPLSVSSCDSSEQLTDSTVERNHAAGTVHSCHSSSSTGDSSLATRTAQCSRREQLRERARMLLQQARRDAVTSPTAPVVDSQDERQRRLRERARKLIAESRAGTAAVTQVITVHSRKPIGQCVNMPTGEMYGLEQLFHQPGHDVNRPTTTDQQSGSPSSTAPITSYAEVEMELLERSLARLDERAAGVEWSLRRIMDSQRHSDDDAQQRLMYEWFALVDERGELVRRIEQLNAVAQEQDLERRFELLSVELRCLMSECENDEHCADRERLLLAELMSIVNQRDALVQQLDKQQHETSVTSAPVVTARKSSRQDSGCSLQ